MTSTITKHDVVQPDAGTGAYLFDDWFDPIEAGLRDRVRGFVETMITTELDAGRHGLPVNEALGPLARASSEIAEIERRTGRTASTV